LCRGIQYLRFRFCPNDNGIKGDAIALFTRILSVADSVDAMTSKRTYSDGLTYSEAVKELLRCSGTQFDEMVVKIFIERVLPDMTLI
jgi:HD-GYP domain-containing protein (c-di-GMP phosphodiesterase class II)